MTRREKSANQRYVRGGVLLWKDRLNPLGSPLRDLIEGSLRGQEGEVHLAPALSAHGWSVAPKKALAHLQVAGVFGNCLHVGSC